MNPLRRFGRRIAGRRFQAYCLGAAKSGTASMASVFATNYLAAHEAGQDALIDFITSATDVHDLPAYPVRQRDRTFGLELDSSQLNLFIARDLVREFPDAKFIITIRDCYSWLDSFVNHSLNRSCNDTWRRFRECRFRHHELTHPPEETSLREKGLYTLEGYFSYWAFHYTEALAVIPPERRLVVRTNEITTSLATIADFLGIDAETLPAGASHANVARGANRVLESLPREHLVEVAERHCATLMDAYFGDTDLRTFNAG